MGVLIDMCTIGILMKQSLVVSLKNEIKELEAKIWTTGAFTTKRTMVIGECFLFSMMSKHCFNMDVNVMPDANQPYMVVIGRNLTSQLQLKLNIVKHTVQ